MSIPFSETDPSGGYGQRRSRVWSGSSPAACRRPRSRSYTGRSSRSSGRRSATEIVGGELFGLTLDRVEFLKRSVRVDQQMVRVRGEGVRLAPLKTAASYRSVPLPAVVAQAIASHLQAWPTDPELGLVFTNERYAPIQQFPFSMVFERARAKADLPEWATPYYLRHFYASTLIRSGPSIRVVQTRPGHSSARTTLDVYGHLFRDEEDRTRQAVEDALSAADIPRTQTQDQR